MTSSNSPLNEFSVPSLTLYAQLGELQEQLFRLLRSTAIRFDNGVRNALPEAHGVYRIFDPTEPNETIRAGHTESAAGGLRQRLYQNHFMGDQSGNLRAQLVADGVCRDMAAAKQFIRQKLAVQLLVIENGDDRTSLERFILAVLKPRY